MQEKKGGGGEGGGRWVEEKEGRWNVKGTRPCFEKSSGKQLGDKRRQSRQLQRIVAEMYIVHVQLLVAWLRLKHVETRF